MNRVRNKEFYLKKSSRLASQKLHSANVTSEINLPPSRRSGIICLNLLGKLLAEGSSPFDYTRYKNCTSRNEITALMLCPSWDRSAFVPDSNGPLNCHLPVIFDKQHKWMGLHASYLPLACHMVWENNHHFLYFFCRNVKSNQSGWGRWRCSRHQKHDGSLSEKLKRPTGNSSTLNYW